MIGFDSFGNEKSRKALEAYYSVVGGSIEKENEKIHKSWDITFQEIKNLPVTLDCPAIEITLKVIPPPNYTN